MIYKLIVPAFQLLTAPSFLFFGNSPPVRIDASATPSAPKVASAPVLSGPVALIVLIGLLLLTAAVVLAIRHFYTPNSAEAARTDNSTCASPTDVPSTAAGLETTESADAE